MKILQGEVVTKLFAEHVANYGSEHIYLWRNMFHKVDITFGPNPLNIRGEMPSWFPLTYSSSSEQRVLLCSSSQANIYQN